MALIKYYNLESQSWEDVSDLERNLQKHLLNEKHVRSLLETDVEDVARAKDGNGDRDTLAMLLYDSGDFEVLYKKSRTVLQGKKRWFGKNTPPRVGTKLVVKAVPEDILELQDYLRDSGFEVAEARNVSMANFGFSSPPCHEEAVKNYRTMIEAFMGRQYPSVSADLTTEDKVVWDGKNGSTCTGMIYGPVLDVLKIREVLLKDGYGVGVKTESVSFLS
jgi:hypothetical protein